MLTPVAEAAYAERGLFEPRPASLRRYPAFVAELTERPAGPPASRQTGTLQVAYDADDLAVLDEHAVLRESFGVPSQRLTGARVPGGRADARPGGPRRAAGRRTTPRWIRGC